MKKKSYYGELKKKKNPSIKFEYSGHGTFDFEANRAVIYELLICINIDVGKFSKLCLDSDLYHT